MAEPDRRRWIWGSVLALCTALGLLPRWANSVLKGMALVRGLVGFNLGVEIGQLLFVAVFLPALMWLSAGAARASPRIASLTVAVIGTYWLVERIFVG